MGERVPLADLPVFCDIRIEDDIIDPDPDIAGIGVIISFLTIGTIVMILTLIKLCLDHWDFHLFDFFIPRATQLRLDGKWPKFDDARKYLQEEQSEDKGKGEGDGEKDEIQRGAGVLSSTMFSLADTQFATGIAICVAAFAKQDLTKYHHLICDEMAWLAFISSTSGFLTARTVLDAANRAKKVVRVTLMWCLFGLTAAVEIRRNDEIGLAVRTYSVGPYWELESAESRNTLVLFVVTFLSVMIDTAALWPEVGVLLYYHVETFVVAIFPPFTMAVSFMAGQCRNCSAQVGMVYPILHFLSHVIFLAFVVILWLPIWIASLLMYWLLFQPLTAHIANCFFFFWGVKNAFLWRGMGRRCMKPEDSNKEDQFGFGQVVAMTLLISPIVANADFWYRMLVSDCERHLALASLPALSHSSHGSC